MFQHIDNQKGKEHMNWKLKHTLDAQQPKPEPSLEARKRAEDHRCWVIPNSFIH